ncbi:putative membrane protein [Vibrio parahaemolyticus VPCR-2009]|nr:putative membrane protein [Vibrio parahaemolyticus VPCR-2009]
MFIAFIVSIIYCSVSSAVSFILQAKLLDTVEISLVILFPFVLLCILMAAKRI